MGRRGTFPGVCAFCCARCCSRCSSCSHVCVRSHFLALALFLSLSLDQLEHAVREGEHGVPVPLHEILGATVAAKPAKWYYRDTDSAATLHGPYTAKKLEKWTSEGHFALTEVRGRPVSCLFLTVGAYLFADPRSLFLSHVLDLKLCSGSTKDLIATVTS